MDRRRQPSSPEGDLFFEELIRLLREGYEPRVLRPRLDSTCGDVDDATEMDRATLDRIRNSN